jgi:hypothetical protein
MSLTPQSNLSKIKVQFQVKYQCSNNFGNRLNIGIVDYCRAMWSSCISSI